WGKWFQAKVNAVDVARKHAHKLAGQAVYVSSVTDPYLPAERSLKLTRGILEALIPYQPRVLIQTRGPTVVRGLAVLPKFAPVRVNVSIPTDSEEVRQVFEPKAPLLERRWEAARSVKEAGLPIGICLTPLLPVQDPDSFVKRLIDFEPDVLVAQSFHDSGGAFGADTGPAAKRLLTERSWPAEAYRQFVARLKEMRTVYEGEEGFFPPATANPLRTSSTLEPLGSK